jgi:hypothetical protein
LIPHPIGLQKGDPFGPFLLDLVLHQVVKRIYKEVSLVPNAWYLDDGTCVGHPVAFQKVLEIRGSPETLALGLHLNINKCIILGMEEGFPPELIVATYCIELLGCPIG